MPSGPIQTVLVSSTGTGATVNLDWMTGGITTVRLTSPSTVAEAASGVLQITVNDPMTSSNTLWSNLSSQGQTTFLSTAVTTGTVISASVIVDSALIYSFTTPIAAVRFNCSAFSSGGFRMDVLQGRA